MSAPHGNVDPSEIGKFDRLASQWWDPQGPLRTLHEINPLRFDYIAAHVALENAKVLDVGCGGGLLCESMAKAGARVTGIDVAENNVVVAKRHAQESGLSIDYSTRRLEELATEQSGNFDVVTCLEVIEHVPSPADTVTACSRVVRPGGVVFFSTINRNPKSFLLAIVGAEYVLGLLPRGTHEYRKLVRPAELARWCRESGLVVRALTGLHYNPLTREYTTGGNVDVNYFCCAGRLERE
jgi:2-polyprenyl-6-hydroxyphenyl methylase/3-demethylubiquinone-9 3-methyltransferase